MADEDFRGTIVKAIRRLEPGLIIDTVQELNLSSATDEEVLEYAAIHGRVVVTHDVNTMRGLATKHIEQGRTMPGLILVPQSRSKGPCSRNAGANLGNYSSLRLAQLHSVFTGMNQIVHCYP
ncbi:MAG TPA: DUF5615 family PIN-like protein [Gemmatales bacterium]|nr:DUF5615 family PIN-like protein [Gemmatales bacterium]HMP18333.1 DUF5615 family PIN-like protein [Gemmatales bacterium]